MIDQEISAAVRLLRESPGYHTSKVLAQCVGLPPKLRDVLRQRLSERTDIVTCSSGMMWIGHATKEQCDHFLAHLRARAASLIERAKVMEAVIKDLHPDPDQFVMNFSEKKD